MIKVEARIKLFDSDDGTVNNAQFNNNNNISWNIYAANGPFGQIVGKEVKQTRPFLLDNTPLVGGEDHEIPKTSDMYVLADRVNYFIGSLVSGEDGTFPNGASYSITINGADFNAITIVFDKDDEVWPTEITINGESYTNDDPTFTAGGFGGVDSLDVTITQLNKPNKGLIVTGVYVDITIVVDDKNLDSFAYGLYDREYNDQPSYGIIANSGTLSFVDSTREVLDYINNRLLTDDPSVCVSIINTSAKESKTEIFINANATTWEYDNNNFVVTVTLNDKLEDLQNITYPGFPYDETYIVASNIYNDIASFIPSSFGFPSLEELPDNVQSRLLSSLANPYMETCSVWDALDGLCKTLGIRIYKEKSNIMVEVQ